MKKKHEHIIQSVRPGSIAEELGIEPGDILLEIDGQVIEDIFDYQFYVESEELLVVIRKANGEEWELEIEKDVDEDLGIDFGKGLMDEYHSCHNKCIFCFIDQMPPGMRDTLYFKDDDSRLSFLQGNYVTLTNMSEKDMNRIVRYRLEPINISFQTTNPELRCKMLHNRFAGEALKKVDILYQGGIEMNGQIVLCRGVNDGEELERSIRDLTQYLPLLRSVSVVPVGLSKYRDGLYPLEPFTKEEAKEVIRTIEKWQKKVYAEYGIHFIHAGDEWYLLAEEEVPEEERYDGYLQLENGVGMLRLLFNEFEEGYAKLEDGVHQEEISLATAKLAYPYLERMAKKMEEKYKEVIRTIEKWQKKVYAEYGIHFIHAGDEWYLLAEEEVPEEERYDGYLQLENGVGMLRLLFNEFEEGYAKLEDGVHQEEISLATAKLAYPYLERMAKKMEEKYKGLKVHTYCIRNDFFGERITVSGLITGQDLMKQLKDQPLGSRLLIPCNMLKMDEDIFLDDYTLKEVSDTLQVPIDIVKSSGQDLIDAILGVAGSNPTDIDDNQMKDRRITTA